MQIQVIVGYGEYIAFFEESVPIEVYIAIGEYVWDVGHSRLVREILYAVAHTAYLVFFIVAHVHLCEIAAYTQPFTETVAGRYIETFCQNFAIVDVCGIFFPSAQVLNVTLYIVLRVAVDKSSFDINGMFSECFGIAEVDVDVVAVFGSNGDISTFQIFITEHFFDRRQAVCFFIGKFGLQSR